MKAVAVIQMVSKPDVTANLRQAEQLLRWAAKQGVGLAVLPENFAVFSTGKMLEYGWQERDADGPIRSFLREQARKLNLWILAGTLPCARRPDGSVIEGRVRAASLLISPDGEEVARYDKIHLFDVQVADAQGSYQESREIEPGDQPVWVDTPWGRLGMAVCYDLRFPELFRYYRQQGASLIALPSAFTKRTGDAHWEVLVRARAIETQCVLLAANQGGVHTETRTTSGDSMVVDAWGQVLNRLAQGPGVVEALLDPARLQEVRAQMPIMQHLRLPTFSVEGCSVED
ncbi:carbon-nitrogen hydrolase family protein [Balneatrix alpica]|uniref:Carbon-nitrogen hydrolase family protein n=1 Tax=Balneatrix alpica TaxID=75684 RepID=A0ABV5ZCC3_9GAMM|nr:carbon-nitrogen hydrolase family protein [Balneatrix alpica]